MSNITSLYLFNYIISTAHYELEAPLNYIITVKYDILKNLIYILFDTVLTEILRISIYLFRK